MVLEKPGTEDKLQVVSREVCGQLDRRSEGIRKHVKKKLHS